MCQWNLLPESQIEIRRQCICTSDTNWYVYENYVCNCVWCVCPKWWHNADNDCLFVPISCEIFHTYNTTPRYRVSRIRKNGCQCVRFTISSMVSTVFHCAVLLLGKTFSERYNRAKYIYRSMYYTKKNWMETDTAKRKERIRAIFISCAKCECLHQTTFCPIVLSFSALNLACVWVFTSRQAIRYFRLWS